MRTFIFFALLLAIASCNSNKPKSTSNTETTNDTIGIHQIEEALAPQEEASEAAITGIYMTDGYFKMDDTLKNQQIKKEFEEDKAFIALITNEEEVTIKPVTIEVMFSENECTGSPDVSMYADSTYNYIALISGLEQYNEKPVRNPVQMITELLPSVPISFEYNNESYTLYATADVEENAYEAKNYRLYFKKGDLVQYISRIDQLEYTMPHVLFIGDIDNDSYPDLLLQEGYNYEYHKMVLYLSSYAGEGELVKNVAVDEEWRDC